MKVENRVDESIAQVVEGLAPFFQAEGITDIKREVMIRTLDYELHELMKDPEDFFAASLDGRKVFDRRYSEGELPQAIRDEELEDLYAMVFPQVANMVCAYPPAIEQWKLEGYRDNFRRLDEIAATLGSVAHKLDRLASQQQSVAEELLVRVRLSLAVGVEFSLDLTGLRGDRPDAVPLEKCFVVPELRKKVKDAKEQGDKAIRVGTVEAIVDTFSRLSLRATVIGAPGSGKSTWSRWLQREQLAATAARLAVVVRLRDLDYGKLPSYHDILSEAAGTHLRSEVSPSIARNWCDQGLVLFILDGFDEVPRERRDDVSAWVKQLGSATANAGIVLTSRPLTSDQLESLPSYWRHWELLPFDQPRITSYISRWYANAPLLAGKSREVDAERLAKQWVEDPTLAPLVGTPLMLATILMVHHMDGQLPGGRAKLYERYIDGMLGLWDSRWKIPATIDLSAEIKRRILTRLALRLHLSQIEQLGDKEIEAFIREILPSLGCTFSAATVLHHLRERSGLLVGPGTWSFIHKNVGEFLVAAAIRDGDQIDADGQKMDRFYLFRKRHDDRWIMVLFFWVGLTSPGDLQSFVEQVIAEGNNDGFLLGLSIIHDQSSRLAEPWRSEQLQRLLKIGYTSESSTGHFYCSPLPAGVPSRIDAPMPSLPPLGRTWLVHALEDCLLQSQLDPYTAMQCHESLQFVTWWAFAVKPRTTQELESALNWQRNGFVLPEPWVYFALVWGTYSPLNRRNEAVTLSSYIASFRRAFPEHAGKVSFALIANFSRYIQNHKSSPQSRPADSLPLLIRELDSLRNDPLDPEWLAASDKFVDAFAGDKQVDLLTRFLSHLDESILKQWVNADDETTRVRVFVTELIGHRGDKRTRPAE